MAAFLQLESREAGSCLGKFVFDCELTGSTRSYTFKVDEDDDSEHILALSMVCLTDGAKDECNVVEVVGRNRQNQEIAVPVANLKLSCQPTPGQLPAPTTCDLPPEIRLWPRAPLRTAPDHAQESTL
ncbi:nucleoplasmin-3 isoform X2 [Chelonoidis abingdonii]|uniref:nucleoplasmin-3 isoform X2 n=1 Tax=Chelonoidis abingdonii TaxID=106734 RepID=UPI0013F1F050|nr:nucleoplasmin-3 isoform X2 [Chelonoidis abingdonii]